MDALALLKLQIEWGADEALEPDPIDRLRARPLETNDAKPPASGIVATPAAVRRPEPMRAAPGLAAARNGQVALAREVANAAADLPALRTAIAGFEGCSLRDTATHLVFAEGDASTGLVIVGEVPNAEEDRAGHPFAGRPGQLLDRMLDSIGLDRGMVLLVPLIPWRPPGDRPPSDLELAICKPFLERLLVLAQPARLLLMGSRPTKLLAGSTIRADAGWQDIAITADRSGSPVPTLAMRHPSYLLSHPTARRESWSALLLLRRTLDLDQETKLVADQSLVSGLAENSQS
ncbi:MAG: uracil-DNA glycosylase [Janthinobacterium lividum]